MGSKNRKIGFAVSIFCLILLVAGILVWPTPKEAFAVDSTFRARVDWNGRTRNDNGIQLRLTTRAAVGGAALETHNMTFVRTVEGVSFYQSVFTPDQRARIWEVTLVNIRQHKWIPTALTIRDRGDILLGVVSELDGAFICIDQQ